ncbi:GntR family transcriptional regulator, partial [Ruminococcaceae bacterium OttesenSCG-928-A11]|nr:GntR family transcriptional regulator [Ruminococcaceae bacterium OttesenSCG-928-A11]
MQIKKNLQQQVYEQLRDQVLARKLAPDVVYSETELAKQLQTSRTPVREALHWLAQEELIDILPSRGFSLHKPTRQDLLETSHVRSAIEGYAVRQLVIGQNTPRGQALIHQLDAIVNKQRRIVQQSHKSDAFAATDQHFHVTIVSSIGSEKLNDMFQGQ